METFVVEDTMQIANVHVINMDGSTDRMKSIEDQCSRENISFTRYPAVNGKDLSVTDINGRIATDSYMYKNLERNRGEIGCALSHMNLWRDNALRAINMFIVVEDDVIFCEKFNQKLNKYLAKAPADWDVIYLGGSNIRGTKVDNNNLFIRPKLGIKGNLGTYAMLINRGGCAKLIAQTTPLRKSIDHQLKEEFNKSLKVYYANPPLITHNNELDSDRRILNKTSNKPSLKWRKFKQNNVEIIAA
jgi:glycosyl transferase family 25